MFWTEMSKVKIKDIKVCKIDKNTYCLANDNCPSKEKKKTIFSGHDILYWVDKNNPRGDVPKNPGNDPQFDAWEKGVQKWAEGQDNVDNVQGDLKDCKSSDF